MNKSVINFLMLGLWTRSTNIGPIFEGSSKSAKTLVLTYPFAKFLILSSIDLS